MTQQTLIPIPVQPRMAKPLALPANVSASVTWGHADPDLRWPRYRLALTWRRSHIEPEALPIVIGLNPSTASDAVADRTLLRLMHSVGRQVRDANGRFTTEYDYSGFCPNGFTMTNLFALRATDPLDLLSSDDPVGAGNDDVMAELIRTRPMIIAAWGAPPSSPKALADLVTDRGVRVMRILRQLGGDRVYVLGFTRHQYPRHPLYLAGGAVPQRWRP